MTEFIVEGPLHPFDALQIDLRIIAGLLQQKFISSRLNNGANAVAMYWPRNTSAGPEGATLPSPLSSAQEFAQASLLTQLSG